MVSGHRPCFRSLDFILRTSRNSSKGFEQGNNDQMCVCEETTGEDWQARCSCGEIISENAEDNEVVTVEIQRNGVIHSANIS